MAQILPLSLKLLVLCERATHEQAVPGVEPLVLAHAVAAPLRRLRQVGLLDAVDAGSRGSHQ